MIANPVQQAPAPMSGKQRESIASAAIEISHLRKTFKDFVAIDDLTFNVERGEIFGLLGPNGSGKTTTINMISGLSQPTGGTVRVLGHDISREPRAIHRILGSMPQETALYEELSAWHNMAFHADLYGVPPREQKARITKLLELVQLQDRSKSRVGTFSGGMKRRLAFARALLHEPELIYMDEPTLGIDVQSRRALWDYTLDLKKQGKTVLLTTNYLEEANELCDRLAIIDHGKLMALDTPTRLKQRYGDTAIDLETIKPLSATLVEKLRALPGVTALDQQGVSLKLTVSGDHPVTGDVLNLITTETTLKTISQHEPSLNEVFLGLTGTALRD
ncbi:MAG: ABC transporter ATP-binding protein [Aggregatilineales bacterium]